MSVEKELAERALNVFPKIYFFVPIFRRRTLTVGSKKLVFSEPMDCILWLLDLLTKDSPDGSCLQGDLEDLVRHWYNLATPSTFNKKLNALEDAGCIHKVTDAEDKRGNNLSLTAAGTKVLEDIRAQRLKLLAPLLDVAHDLPPSSRGKMLDTLDLFADAAWKRMIVSITEKQDE